MKKRNNNTEIYEKVRPRKVLLPVLIGLGVVVYMLSREFDPKVFSLIKFTWHSLFFTIIAIVMMAIRDFGYMLRLRMLTGEELSWNKVFKIIMLWEFTSAITPSAIGGTSVAIFFLYKEGYSVGKSSAVVMATSFLDELYFIIMFPLLFLLVSGAELFTIGTESFSLGFANKYFYFAVIGYSLKLIFTGIVGYGLFINPRGLKFLLMWVFKLSPLRKWRYKANEAGSDLIDTSKELKGKSFRFWLKAFMATFFSWSARYWVVNFLLLALIFGVPEIVSDNILSFADHFLIFARQLVMWIMMLVMPTPGGSGFAEAIFSEYMAEFIPVGFVVIMALFWRFVSYYPYLFIGVFILPKWMRKHIARI